jgi:uncharacterized protein
MYLIDINALIALADQDHNHHSRAAKFFQKATIQGWATCPLIENGFLRILGHPQYPKGPGSPEIARKALNCYCSAPGHVFWADSISLREKKRFTTLPASKNLTDYYLLALAVQQKALFATLDQRIDASLIPGGTKAYFIIP